MTDLDLNRFTRALQQKKEKNGLMVVVIVVAFDLASRT
jgi:hypothetical protein